MDSPRVRKEKLDVNGLVDRALDQQEAYTQALIERDKACLDIFKVATTYCFENIRMINQEMTPFYERRRKEYEEAGRLRKIFSPVSFTDIQEEGHRRAMQDTLEFYTNKINLIQNANLKTLDAITKRLPIGDGSTLLTSLPGGNGREPRRDGY